jgi:antitoxin ParD1/3/4
MTERPPANGRRRPEGDMAKTRRRVPGRRESRIEALRAVLIEGEQSGPSTPFDLETFIGRKRRKAGRSPEPAA